jgi:HK97 family phage major capsid protein
VPYNSLTSRTDVQPLIPEVVVNDMLGKATEQSAVLSLFPPIPVASNQVRFPILSALPIAYWVTGDTGLKQTTELSWSNKFLTIEEIATILPVPENVIDDLNQNIWDESKPLMVEAIGRVLDTAVFFGTNAPVSFPTNILAAAAAAANVVDEGSSTAAQGGFFGDIDKLYGVIEADGYDATGFLGPTSLKSKLRATRATDGQKLDTGRVSGDLRFIDGYPAIYPMRGLWPVAGGVGVNGVRAFAGDFTQFRVGVRKDVSYKVLDQAVITDNTNAIIYNLPQQDMLALRVTFRVGWQVANTINNEQPVEASRYPVGYIRVVGA